MKRVITSLALALATSYVIFLGPAILFKVVIAIVGATCYWEYSGLVEKYGIRRPLLFGFLTGALLLFAANASLIGLSLLAAAALAWAMRHDDVRGAMPGAAAGIFGAIYTFLPWHFAELLRAHSVHWLFFALALNWAGDSAAFYSGRAFGKHRLAPVVSPNKSWEGAIGSVFGSVIFGVLYMGWFVPSEAWWKIAIIAVVANVSGQLGDLAESAIKRGAGVKDSGAILPGHGGLLDRVDSSLFALPVVWALTQLW